MGPYSLKADGDMELTPNGFNDSIINKNMALDKHHFSTVHLQLDCASFGRRY